MYNIKTKQVKNSLIPSLSNDYYSKQLILTNNYQNELSELPFLENTKNNIANETDNQKIYDIPLILQNPKYPNGCEAATAVMLLNYYGIDINLDEFINLLPKSPIMAPDLDLILQNIMLVILQVLLKGGDALIQL